MEKIECVDSHTGGEPTRVVLSGFPGLEDVPLTGVVHALRTRYDRYRRATVCEPRGNDVMVGALVLSPRSVGALASIVFFNNAGYLGMCGHGTIGVMATLAYLGRVGGGSHVLDTPAGTVQAHLHDDGEVSVDNVPAYRHMRAVQLDVPGVGRVVGDVAWGGNWFFLCDLRGVPLQHDALEELTRCAWAIRRALVARGIAGRDGAEIDHIELMGPAGDASNHARNFVLCPGGAYDRSPCGTGTSAKLACLASDGAWPEGAVWRQESVLGSVFEAHYRVLGGAEHAVAPTIRGRAHICGEATLVLDPHDPLCWGVSWAR